MIPALPADAVRAAIEADDWQRATDLLQAHDAAVVQTLAGVDFATAPRAPWLDLLAAQHALAGEVRAARDEAGRQLARLGQDRRGARAWQQALA
jgi:hypothetical protein